MPEPVPKQGAKPSASPGDCILGISAFYHDSAACLIRDGRVVAAVQEERFTRRKHDADFPVHAIDYCLQEAGMKITDLTAVSFHEKPFIKFDRLLHTYLTYAPSGLRSFLKAMPIWLRDRIWVKNRIAQRLGFPGTILFPEHHESHAASAFYPSPFDSAAFLTVDGVGEWTTTSYGVGKGKEIRIHGDIGFPHSLGLLYSAFTYYTGFRVNSGEYKVMGLAPYGRPLYKEAILKEMIDLKEDGSFRLNMDYFGYGSGLTMTNRRFDKLLGGPPRRPESKLSQRDMDLARSVQEVAEEVMLRMARFVRQETGERHLCLAGGVALNSVANGQILREKIFDRIWIQPAAGDAGGALGAAWLAWHQYLGHERSVSGGKDHQQGSLLGPAYERLQIAAFLKEEGAEFKELDDEVLVQEVAELLSQENVIGWFQGRMEFGPRALGARSILGDPRSPRMQETMNLKIKFRESFRPFAPVVLAERVKDYFDLDADSPYMQLVAPVAEKVLRELSPEQKAQTGLERRNVPRSAIPAVTHVDNSARIQTVRAAEQPLFHALLKEFETRTGCGVLINTSFNVRGEPIVCTPQDAYRCFMRTNMDYLVLGNFLVKKTEQKPLDENLDWLKEYELD